MTKTILVLAIVCVLIIGTLSVEQFTFAQANTFFPFFVQDATTDADVSNNNAARLINIGDYQGALRFIESTLEIDPNHVVAIYNKGVISLELNKPNEALVWFEKNQDIKAKDISTLNEIGRILLELEKPEEALVWFDKVLEIDPSHVDALNNKGLSLFELGKPEEAMIWFDKALTVDPNYELAKTNKELAENPEEESFYDTISPFFVMAIAGLVFYVMYRVQKNRKHHISNIKQIIDKPSFSVLKIRWAGSNITYQVVFDTERILFIRPDKISKDPTYISLDEILKMDKQNLEIPFNEIKKIEFKDSTIGINSARAGKMIVDSEKYQGPFDILESESLAACINLTTKFLQNKVSTPYNKS